jgi:hypothetical protein
LRVRLQAAGGRPGSGGRWHAAGGRTQKAEGRRRQRAAGTQQRTGGHFARGSGPPASRQLEPPAGALQPASCSLPFALCLLPSAACRPHFRLLPPAACRLLFCLLPSAFCFLPPAACRPHFRLLPPAACRLLAAPCFLLAGFWILTAEIIDRIAISVGNLVITESQVEEEIRLTAFLNQDKLNLDNAERKKAAGRLIEQTLVRREMEFSHYPLPQLSDAAKSLDTLKTRYKTQADYQQALDSYGITEDGLKRRLWWQETFLRFIDYRFRPGIQIPDADVQANYQQQLNKWKQEGLQPVPNLEDVRASIEQTLTEQRIDQAMDRWLAETRTQVAIRFHDKALE